MCAGSRSRRTHLAALALLTAPALLAGVPVLRPPGSVAIASATDFRGSHVVTETFVEPAHRITLLLLLDTLSEADLKPLQPAVLKLLRDIAGKAELRIALLGNGAIQFAGPFSAPLQLRAAWREIPAPAQLVPRTPESAVALAGQIVTAVPRLGDSWSHVLVAGRIPAIPADAAEYAGAWALNSFATQRIRLSILSLDGADAGFLAPTVAATAGVYVTSLDEFLSTFPPAGGQYLELNWDSPPLSAGYHLHTATLRDASNSVVLSVPQLSPAAGFALPNLSQVQSLQQNLAKLDILAKSPPPGDTGPASVASEAGALLQAALAVNPCSAAALRAGAVLYERLHDRKAAGHLLQSLAELEPENGAVFDALGIALFDSGDSKAAEAPLRRARQLGVRSAPAAERLARIEFARGHPAAAMPLAEENLAAEPRNLSVWLLRAGIASASGDWARQSDSLEHALGLDASLLDQRVALIQGYLSHNQPSSALPHIRALTAAMPPSAPLRVELAEWWETLGKPVQALAVWRKAVEADGSLEPARFGLARLTAAQGDTRAALDAASAGIEAAPRSARIRLLQHELYMKSGDWYPARRALSAALSAIPGDRALLEAATRSEDAYGTAAPALYRRLAEVPGRMPLEQARLLERGRDVSLREGDMKTAEWFEGQMAAIHGPRSAAVVSNGDAAASASAPVPGGLGPLAALVRIESGLAARTFFLDFSRSLAANNLHAGKKALDDLTEAVHKYFQRVHALEAMGRREGDSSILTLSLTDKNSRKYTGKVLSVLGLKLVRHKGELRVEANEKQAASGRQDAAVSLEFDPTALQEALAQNRTFRFELVTGHADVFPAEPDWRRDFYEKDNLPGGFAEALSRDLRLAKVYTALNSIDRPSAETLLAAIPLKTLVQSHADLLFHYGACIAVRNGHVMVPGGDGAEVVWNRVLGASPFNPVPFLQALLTKDGGGLLAFYETLSELDVRRQRFFTRSAARLEKFYEHFRQSPESGVGGRVVRQDSFVDFLREMPVDDGGRVLFPGGPEVWLVAKGASGDNSLRRLQKKMSKVTVPDQEDAILLRLAGVQYSLHSIRRSELDNLIAVARVEAHRQDPMDPASALLLAQRFARFDVLFPYLNSLTAMDFEAYRALFALADKLETLSRDERRFGAGLFHGVIALLAHGEETGRLTPRDSAASLRTFSEAMLRAARPADQTGAALAALRALLAPVTPVNPTDTADVSLEVFLTGHGGDLAIPLDAFPRPVPWGALRSAQYRHVLALQKVPSLQSVLSLATAAWEVIDGGDRYPAAIARMASEPPFPSVDIPKAINSQDRDTLNAWNPSGIPEAVRDLQRKAAKKKPNPKELKESASVLLDRLRPQLILSIAGAFYALYLRPADMVVSEDPLLLRKHLFTDEIQTDTTAKAFPPIEFRVASEGAGSRFVGGLAGFGAIAGDAVASSKRSASRVAQPVASALWAAARSTEFLPVTDRHVQLMALRVRAAREWIVQAAFQPPLALDLAEETLGLLSLTRRTQLLGAIAARRWSEAWDALTLTDLYFLGEAAGERYKQTSWNSPVLDVLRAAGARKAADSLDVLGIVPLRLNGCIHPHLARLAPYEHYTRQLLPYRFAERTAELRLRLALLLDQFAIPAEALNALTEPFTELCTNRLQMRDMFDWPNVHKLFTGLDGKALQTSIEAIYEK